MYLFWTCILHSPWYPISYEGHRVRTWRIVRSVFRPRGLDRTDILRHQWVAKYTRSDYVTLRKPCVTVNRGGCGDVKLGRPRRTTILLLPLTGGTNAPAHPWDLLHDRSQNVLFRLIVLVVMTPPSRHRYSCYTIPALLDVSSLRWIKVSIDKKPRPCHRKLCVLEDFKDLLQNTQSMIRDTRKKMAILLFIYFIINRVEN